MAASSSAASAGLKPADFLLLRRPAWLLTFPDCPDAVWVQGGACRLAVGVFAGGMTDRGIESAGRGMAGEQGGTKTVQRLDPSVSIHDLGAWAGNAKWRTAFEADGL